MDRLKCSADIIQLIAKCKDNQSYTPALIKAVCTYYDQIKEETISRADYHFLRYIANMTGIPQYYKMLEKFKAEMREDEYDVDLDLFSMMVNESALHTSADIQLHKYQKQVLDSFTVGTHNRYFLSASTSFGKTFLVYEVLRKMNYRNIALIFPTISLLSENLFKIYTEKEYLWVKDNYVINTLSDASNLGEKNILIFTPERYLSFVDKNPDFELDFVFVDEVYKLDNEFIIDEDQKENERDIAYRIALNSLLREGNTDCLLAGPYIVQKQGDDSSFTRFLDYYGFESFNYNAFEIVDKKETIVGRVKKLIIDENQTIAFSKSTKAVQFVELSKYLFDNNESSIVYCSRKDKVESFADALIKHRGFTVDTSSYDDLLNHLDSLYKKRGKNWIVTRALRHGIGVHHGLVPKYIQNEIIRLFNEAKLKVLICTTTITEGVNTTAKNMIILSGKKGSKDLKKFDAQNIEGRAGRFMQHYQGHVYVLDPKFTVAMNKTDENLQHKHFDKDAPKYDVDLPLTIESYLTDLQRRRWVELQRDMVNSGVPTGCFNSFKTISQEDKIYLYNTIMRYSDNDFQAISYFIRAFNGKKIAFAGLSLICQSVRNIVKNEKLRFYIENSNPKRPHCYLVDLISIFLQQGLIGSVNYNIDKGLTVDKAVRKAADFVFVILRYQVVKYFGLYNLIYKYVVSQKTGNNWDLVPGIDPLLMKLEYNAETPTGCKASDIGASINVIKYFDLIDKHPELQDKFYDELDNFEKQNVNRINLVLGKQ